MGSFKALRSALTGREASLADPDPGLRARADELLRDYLQEASSSADQANIAALILRPSGSPSPAEYEAGRLILGGEPALQIAVIRAALDWSLRGDVLAHFLNHYLDAMRAGQLASQLVRRRQPYTAQDVDWILQRLAGSRSTWTSASLSGVPLQGLLRSIERWSRENQLPDAARRALEKIRKQRTSDHLDASGRKVLALVDELLGAENALLIDERDDWGHEAAHSLAGLSAEKRGPWLRVLEHAVTARGSKPSKRWLDEAGSRIERLGIERFHELAGEWLGLLNRPSRDLTYRRDDGFNYPTAYLAERNADLLKGLAWCCARFDDDATARLLGDAALACFRKIPNIGARSTKAGNACLHSLGAVATPAAIAQLQRLEQRIKLPSARRQVEKALEDAARRTGLSREDLDELSIPTFGLDGGRIEIPAGNYRAEISLAGSDSAELRWFRPDGRRQVSVPADVRRGFPAVVTQAKQTLKDLRAALAVQRSRLEQLFLADRDWLFDDWRARYCDHPLVSHFARRLIWTFSGDWRSDDGIWLDGRTVDVEGAPLDWITPETRVRLWHPIDADAARVLAWREWLERHEVSQPFKQAHREVYILTDAERETAVYSNRFAAHILRQHQLQALCQQRGWQYRLQGAWDSFDIPALDLLRAGLRAEFWVEPLDDDRAGQSAHGIYLYVSSDQVRFLRSGGGEPVPLEAVPPLVFSEVMRDVDLFVSITSIGNDPYWLDGGPGAVAGYDGYWWNYSFGDLSATAQSRREALERLLPRLTALDGRWALADRFLVVRGDLRSYKIHLGSGNVLMEPNDQYLCIVPGRGAAEAGPSRIFLPFEGDSQLSIILSKAFLLAADTRIKDPMIRNQIRAK